MITSIPFEINPDHLIYTVVCAHPALHTLTDLDRIVLSGLLLSGTPSGSIKLKDSDRRYLETTLQLSPQGLSNSIKRLIDQQVIIRDGWNYILSAPLVPLGGLPKRLGKGFNIKLVTNKQ